MFQTQLPTGKPKGKRRFLPLLSGFLVVALLAGALVFSVSARGGGAHAASAASASGSGSNIAHIALGQIGGHCSQYYGCPYPGEWCAEFASWVWSHAGANTSGITAGSGSFYIYGQNHHTLSNTPSVGDAVVFGYDGAGFAQHVALVVSVDTSNHTIKSVGGNEGGGAGIVAEDGPYNWTVGYSSYWGMNISGYIAPVGGASSTGEEDVFWQGTDNNLWHAFWTNNRWNGPFKIGMGPLNSPPSVAVLPGGEEDVFWQGTDNNLWHAFWTSKWNGAFKIGMGPLGSTPTVAVIE